MISPNDTFTVYLDTNLPESDRGPESRRPALVYRYGTAAELAEHENRLDDLKQLSGRAYLDALEAAASHNLKAICNLVKPDGTPAERLSEAMTVGDLRAIAHRLTLLTELSEPDRKNSESQSPTPAAAAVAGATPPKASA